METVSLLPRPRRIEQLAGQHTITPGRRIVLDGLHHDHATLHAARRLQAALQDHANVAWELAATQHGSAEEIGAVLRHAPEAVDHPQGYTLQITPEQIIVQAPQPAGIFYAVCTLVQLLRQYANQLPCLRIEDWPDFAARGVMLDISRDKVPTMETLKMLVDMLAGWKYNQLQLYTEHTFAYRQHPEVWAQASPYTGEEMLDLDLFCRERQIDLVPNQNSFGHMKRWLIHPRYASLAETHEAFTTQWGTMQGPFSLCPGDEGSLALVRSLYDELLPHFSSRMFNIGCDETFDLGQGRSRADVEQRGEGRVYLDFLQKIYREVTARGRIMQFWGDIIIQHPELIADLPRDAITLEWGYEADHPFAEHCPRFAQSGLPFYVCPGTSSWCSIGGRTDNALGNLLNAAENGVQQGAAGYLVTDWGDQGHWQVLPISYLGFAAGAGYSWALDANRDLDIARVVSEHAFLDPSGALGRVAYDMGNVYRTLGFEPSNSSLLFWVMQLSFDNIREYQTRAASWTGVTPSTPTFDQALEAIDAVMETLSGTRAGTPDAALINDEWEHTARLLRHACFRGKLMLDSSSSQADTQRSALDHELTDIVSEYKRIWLLRNRPGGLQDSVAKLEQGRADYIG